MLQFTSRWLGVAAVALIVGFAGQARAQVGAIRLVSLECVKPQETDGDLLQMDVYNGPMLFLRLDVGPMRRGQVLTLDRRVAVAGKPWFILVRRIGGMPVQLVNKFEFKLKQGLQTADIKGKGGHYRLQYEWVR